MPGTVAIAACRTEDGSGLYPDADWPRLQAALAAHRIDARRVAWDDPTVPWETFGLVVIRSTWDSGGGRETARYDGADAGDADAHIARLRSQGRTVMVQPYLPAISDRLPTR